MGGQLQRARFTRESGSERRRRFLRPLILAADGGDRENEGGSGSHLDSARLREEERLAVVWRDMKASPSGRGELDLGEAGHDAGP